MFKRWAEKWAAAAQAHAEAEAEEEAEYRRQLAEVRSNQIKILRIVQEGAIPKIDWPGSLGLDRLPFRFLKSERPILVLIDVEYSENKVRRRTVGRTSGASFRVARGVSIRTGGYSGTPVEYEELVTHGVGVFAVTNKHIYFAGDLKNVRIPHGKIVSLERASDEELKITRDRASGLPEFFAVGSLWLDCTLGVLESVSAIDFGGGEPEVRELPDAEIHVLDGDVDLVSSDI